MARQARVQAARAFLSIIVAAVLSAPAANALSPATVTVSVSPNPVAYGQPATITAAVTPGPATGKVTFFDGVAPLGVATLTAGHAALVTRALAPGPHSLRAIYSGDSIYEIARSAAAQETVRGKAQAGFTAGEADAMPSPVAVAVGDFDGDGNPDAVAANSTAAEITVLLGRGDGSSRLILTYPVGLNPASIVTADFNGDGKADLAVANSGSNTISILIGNGDGTFQTATSLAAGASPCSMAAADFNGDGAIDLAVTNCQEANAGIYLGRGNGAFAAPVNYPAGRVPSAIAIGDFDGDGNADLAIANGGDQNVAILTGNGDGSFKAPATFATNNRPLSVAVADFNGDGRPDIVASGFNNAAILINNGAGGFAAAVSYQMGVQPYSVVTGDFDGDGNADALFGGFSAGAIVMLTGKGDGTFRNAAAPWYWGGRYPASMATGDFNGDGLPDLAIADEGGQIVFALGAAPAALTVNCLVPGGPMLLDSTGWSAPCSVANGTGPYRWAVSSGSTPPGIFLSDTAGSTSTVKGTPVMAGPYSFAVTATDSTTPAPQSASWAFAGSVVAAVPAITGFNPATAAGGSSAFTLTVNGSGFENGAIVKWNGVSLATSFAGASQAAASVPANLIAAAGTVSIVVVNPDGGISQAAAYTITARPQGGGTSGGGGGSGGGGATGGGGSPGPAPGGGGGGGGGGSSSAITLSASSLSFNWTAGAPAPDGQSLALFAGIGSTAYSISIDFGSAPHWLRVSSSSGKTPSIIYALVDPAVLLQLSAGTYTAQMYILSANGALKTPVSLTVTAPGAASVSVAPSALILSAVRGGPVQTGQIAVLNSGSQTGYSATVSPSAPGWLNLTGGASGTASSTAPGVVTYSVDPSATGPGIFSGALAVSALGRNMTIPVTFAVTSGAPLLKVSQSALAFAGSGAQTIAVSTSSAGPLNWTAASTAAWLQVAPSSGQTSAANPASIALSANASGLQPGTYYGSVNFTSPGAANSSQTVTVVLNAAGAAGLTAPAQASGVMLSGGGSQQLTVADASGTPQGFVTAAATSDGGNWLSVTPPIGVPKNGGAAITVSADAAAAGSGRRQGLVAVGFDDGTIQTVPVTLIGGGCQPSSLLIPAAANGGAAQAGLPQTIAATVTDDCGNPATGANTSVQVSFTNGDPAISLNPAAVSGAWQGTWIPANTSARMQAQITAEQGSLAAATQALPFSVAVGSNAPGAPAAILNAASGTQPQVVAPGSYVAIYGSQLAAPGYGLATATPFTSTLDGAQVFLGGQPLPVYYASPSQINALVPQSLPANTVAQLTVQRGGTISAPIPVAIASYQPGIYSQNQAGTGQGSIEISGTALLAAPESANSRPAQRGVDYIAIFCTGLGPVKGQNGEPPPADGYPALYPPLYSITSPIKVSVGGVDAPVVFSGLTPTLVGLYQVNALVPATAPAGDSIPVVVTVTDPATGAASASNMVTIAVQ